MFDLEKNIRMKIDASDLTIETCILQMHDEKWHSITYFSKKLTSVEQNYDIHDKKLLTIITALKQWKAYAKEALFLTIYTNHKNLITFITIKQLNRRQIQWSKLLNQYKLKIIYTSEKKNDRIDALNWRSDYMRRKEIFNQNILKINNDKSLSFNKCEFNVTIRILRDDQEQYSVIKKSYRYQTTKSMIALKNIMMNLCKNIREWRRLCNFYDANVNFLTYDRKLKFTSRSVLIVYKINMQLTLNMMKFSMQNHW